MHTLWNFENSSGKTQGKIREFCFHEMLGTLSSHIENHCAECENTPYLCHLLPVGFGVEGSLCQEDGMLLWGHTQLVVEGVMPDLLHIVPVGDDTVLDGVFQGEDTSLALSLISHIAVLLSHTHHHSLEHKK